MYKNWLTRQKNLERKTDTDKDREKQGKRERVKEERKGTREGRKSESEKERETNRDRERKSLKIALQINALSKCQVTKLKNFGSVKRLHKKEIIKNKLPYLSVQNHVVVILYYIST